MRMTDGKTQNDVFWSLLTSIGVSNVNTAKNNDDGDSVSSSALITRREFRKTAPLPPSRDEYGENVDALSVDNKTVKKSNGSGFYAYDPELEMNHIQEERGIATAAEEGIWWSAQAQPLKKLLAEERHLINKRLARLKISKPPEDERRDADFIFRYFQDLNFNKCGIKCLDKSLLSFTNLKELCVTGNGLTTLENIPPSVVVLNAYANSITTISPPSTLLRLFHLGLGYNQISSIEQIRYFKDHLVSLDLSYNDLVDLKQTIQELQEFKNLKFLWLQGNPLSLCKYYRSAVIVRLLKLQLLDGIQTREEVEETPAQTRQKKDAERTSKKGGKVAEKKPDKRKQDEEKAQKEAEAKILQEKITKAQSRHNTHRQANCDEALDNKIILRLSLHSLEGLEDPGMMYDLMDDGDKNDKAGAGRSPRAVKKEAKKPAKGGKGGGGKNGAIQRGDWLQQDDGSFTRSEAEESKTERGAHTIIEREFVTRFEHFIRYRLQDDEIHETTNIQYKDDEEVLPINQNKTLEIIPGPLWRDLFDILGIDFLLFKRRTTNIKTITKQSRASETPDNSKTTGRTNKKDKKDKTAGNATDEDSDVVVTEAKEQEESLLGVCHLDTSIIMSKVKDDVTVFSVTTDLEFQFVDTTNWDPLIQRRVGRLDEQQEQKRVVVSAMGDRGGGADINESMEPSTETWDPVSRPQSRAERNEKNSRPASMAADRKKGTASRASLVVSEDEKRAIRVKVTLELNTDPPPMVSDTDAVPDSKDAKKKPPV